MPAPWVYGAIYTSNVVIFFACTIMSALMLWTFFHKKDIPFSLFSFLSYVFYNFFHGFTRITEILFFYKSTYEVHAVAKILCAVVSSVSVAALWISVKKAGKFPGVAKMQSEIEAEKEKRQKAEELVLPYIKEINKRTTRRKNTE